MGNLAQNYNDATIVILVVLLKTWLKNSVVGKVYSRKKEHACDLSEERAKKGKIFEDLSKNVQNLKICLRRAVSCVRLSHAWNS